MKGPKKAEKYFKSESFKKLIRSLKKCPECNHWFRQILDEKICPICENKKQKKIGKIIRRKKMKWKRRGSRFATKI